MIGDRAAVSGGLQHSYFVERKDRRPVLVRRGDHFPLAIVGQRELAAGLLRRKRLVLAVELSLLAATVATTR